MKQGLSTLQMFLVKQSVNHDYFRLMLEGTNERSELPETSFDEIAIMNEGNEYTPEFVQLLKDYYLYL
jgi:tRNA1Val (adenine37-N6)-methyltransferase